MKRWILLEASYIASTLLAPGSVVTEEDLGPDTEPGRALVEVDENLQPVTDDGRRQLLQSGVLPLGTAQIAPVNPHAPNPTRPQAIPPRAVLDPALATDRGYVPAEGVESNEAVSARAEQTDQLIRRQAEISEQGQAQPEAPQRRTSARSTDSGSTGGEGGGEPIEPGPLDQSIEKLSAHLDGVDDRDELTRLRAAETAGKSRTGALDAIDARIAAIDEQGNSGNGGNA